MSPLVLLTVGVILVFTPLSILASVFLWRLHREDPANHFALVLALMAITRTFAAILLAIPTLFYIAGLPQPFSGQLILVAIDILLPTGVVVAAYLRWLRDR